MRIAVVATFTHPDHHGGAERVIGEVSAGLAARGHDVTLITSNPGDAPADETREGVAWRRYPLDRSSSTRFYRSAFTGARDAFRRLVAEGPPDVVSLHQLASAFALVSPGLPRLPRVLSFYAPYHEEFLARFREGRESGRVGLGAAAVSRVLRLADQRVVRRADEIVVLSRFSAGQVDDLGGREPVVAPPGIDLERFRPAADDAERRACRRALGLPDDERPLVVSVRRLVPRMGLTDLVEALALTGRDAAAPRLAIAGTGPEHDLLRARVDAAGLAERVTLLGRVDEARLPDLYRSASLFALPTRSLEGFGMVTGEALASGLPVVATRVGANAEVLQDVPGARLVPPEDPAALRDALLAILSDPAARAAAGRAARAHAEAHLTWDGHLDALLAAMQRARQAHARADGPAGGPTGGHVGSRT